MLTTMPGDFGALWAADRDAQNAACRAFLAASDEPVRSPQNVWDEVVAQLGHKDNHNRAIAAQLLCNLAKSDPDQRMQAAFPALLAVTRDARFVTARHALQSLWKVGAASESGKALVLDGLERSFVECQSEKNCTLIRYDIMQSLRNVYDAVSGEPLKARALALIELEPDPRYRKKYAGVWKGA